MSMRLKITSLQQLQDLITKFYGGVGGSGSVVYSLLSSQSGLVEKCLIDITGNDDVSKLLPIVFACPVKLTDLQNMINSIGGQASGAVFVEVEDIVYI